MAKERGSSLLELLTVISIIGVACTTLTLAPLRDYVRPNARHASQRLAATIRELFLRSTLEQRTCTLRLSRQQFSAQCGNDRSEVFSLPPGSTIQIGEEAARALFFYPTSTTSPHTVRIRDSLRICTISLSLRGRTREQCL